MANTDPLILALIGVGCPPLEIYVFVVSHVGQIQANVNFRQTERIHSDNMFDLHF